MTCARCGSGIFKTEDFISLNKVWHKGCFTCYHCDKRLDKCSAKIFQGELFCDGCYTRVIEKLFGALSTSSLNRPCRVVSTPSCNKTSPGLEKRLENCEKLIKSLECCTQTQKKITDYRKRNAQSCICIPTSQNKEYCFLFPIPREVANYYNRTHVKNKRYKDSTCGTSPPAKCSCCPRSLPPTCRMKTMEPCQKCFEPSYCRRVTCEPVQCLCCAPICSRGCECCPPCSETSPALKRYPPSIKKLHCPDSTCQKRLETNQFLGHCPKCRCQPEPSGCQKIPSPACCCKRPTCQCKPEKTCSTCQSSPCCCPIKNPCCPKENSCCPTKNLRYPTKNLCWSAKNQSPTVTNMCCSNGDCRPTKDPCCSPKNECCPSRNSCYPEKNQCCCKKSWSSKMAKVQAVCTACCIRCGQKVYAAEKILVSSGAYHTSCFSCYCCNKLLDVKNVFEGCGEIYCKQCYNHFFGVEYYGFGRLTC